MLEALEQHKGIVLYAARAANVGRSTHYKWMEEDEEYRKAVEELENTTIDYVENKLIERIEEGDTTATIFYLKTKGKKRGYVERQEVTGKDGAPINPDLSKLSTDELRKILREKRRGMGV